MPDRSRPGVNNDCAPSRFEIPKYLAATDEGYKVGRMPDMTMTWASSYLEK